MGEIKHFFGLRESKIFICYVSGSEYYWVTVLHRWHFVQAFNYFFIFFIQVITLLAFCIKKVKNTQVACQIN